MSSLDILRDLTPTLAQFPPVVIEKNNYVEWQVKNGKCFAWSLLHEPSISICRSFLSKGTIFPKHKHEEREWLIVYEGKLTVYILDDCIELFVGQSTIIEPDIEHSIMADEDTMVLGVTIPASKEYPHGQ